ncbi:hypothetical protein A7U60_g8576 [Sanghuangporus baumii]|uniref:Glutamyl-tRNA amidotransferase complex subunit Gta3 domain-containing protein n=1 Tax=Sanghuangporus baumii TaxID=108892 RepID=A0A9Q5N8K9_SANBA|nr:hypothetical protein A7U60_g8576 [Sanghuangporus baumii]
MQTTRRLAVSLKCNKRIRFLRSLRHKSSSQASLSSHPYVDAEQSQEDPIPATPTWSVHTLLESYPRPQISHAELTKLHTLSALVPPKEGSEEAERMQGELEELVRLVEAVKLVDTSKLEKLNRDSEKNGMQSTIPDGRIWEEGRGMTLSSNTREVEFEDPDIESGKELLKHAKLTKDGFYVVEADRRKK